MKRFDLLHLALLLAVLILAALFWLTPYTYHHHLGGALVRIHRVTGNTDMLGTSEWQAMKSPEAHWSEWAASEEKPSPSRPARLYLKDDIGLGKDK